MKKKLIYIGILTLGISLTACEKTVQVTPENTLLPAQALQDVNGYQTLLSAAYNGLQSYTYWGRDMILEGDCLADNIFTVTGQSGGRYNGQNLFTKSSTYGIWTATYGLINIVNTIITGIDAAPATTAQVNAKTATYIKAQAYALRALFYFDIARIYGFEPTNIPATGPDAGFDRSAVIRLTPTTSSTDADMRNRNSIIETYTQIESDFLKSITLFQSVTSVKPVYPYAFSESAAHAFLAKVYLYWGRYSDCVTQCQAAINPTICYGTLTPVGTYSTAFKKIPNTEAILELNYVQSIQVAGVTGSNDAPYTYTQPTSYGFAGVGLPGAPTPYSTFGGQTVSAELLAAFDSPNDDRKAMFFTSRTATTATSYTWCNKYSGANGPYTDNIEMIRYSDVLLMQAEALAAQGAAFYVQAAALITTLRNARNATVAPVPTDATLPAFIQAERRRELFFEGQRFFDLKRLGQGITKASATAVGTISAIDPRLIAPLPSSEVLFNPNLPQNPTY
jgi:hypothetical protein